MTQLMEKALAEINKLSTEDQDAFAAWIIDELDSERRWTSLLEQSEDLLEQLAGDALTEHCAGKTLPLNPGGVRRAEG